MGCVMLKSMALVNMQRKVTFALHLSRVGMISAVLLAVLYRRSETGARYFHPDKRSVSDIPKPGLPNCIIIGVKKGGTRALLTYLDMHPDIAVSHKVTHFFDHNYSKGLDWYRKEVAFAYNKQVNIEKMQTILPTRTFRVGCMIFVQIWR